MYVIWNGGYSGLYVRIKLLITLTVCFKLPTAVTQFMLMFNDNLRKCNRCYRK